MSHFMKFFYLGRITLKSNNPMDGPVIHGNQLSDPADVAGLVAGINVIEKLVATEALQAYNFTLNNTQLAACSNYTFNTDEYWACAVRQNPYPENHQAGSCKMGPSSDTLAVVDMTLKVHGLERIRVIDASIMPTVSSVTLSHTTRHSHSYIPTTLSLTD